MNPTPVTAAEKIHASIRELQQPASDAGEIALMLATAATMAERRIADELYEAQREGKLDDFIRDLARWLTSHRSDTAKRLVVVELPRGQDLPAATRLRCLELAEDAAAHASLPL